MTESKENKVGSTTPPPANGRRNLNESQRGLDTSPVTAAVVAALGPVTAKPKTLSEKPKSDSTSK